MKRAMKLTCLLGLLAMVFAAGLTLTSSPADAARPAAIGPGPLCGWSALWTCTLPNGNQVQIAGTQCDIRRFERLTGATCEL